MIRTSQIWDSALSTKRQNTGSFVETDRPVIKAGTKKEQFLSQGCKTLECITGISRVLAKCEGFRIKVRRSLEESACSV